jgi:hypothetical protein
MIVMFSARNINLAGSLEACYRIIETIEAAE